MDAARRNHHSARHVRRTPIASGLLHREIDVPRHFRTFSALR